MSGKFMTRKTESDCRVENARSIGMNPYAASVRKIRNCSHICRRERRTIAQIMRILDADEARARPMHIFAANRVFHIREQHCTIRLVRNRPRVNTAKRRPFPQLH